LLFGHDRNLSEAAKYMALAAEKGCGRCFFYLGAMLALGEPETNVSARFKVLSDGNIEFRCLDTNRYSQEKEMMK
jgi:TPR repeat protein